MNPQEEGLGGRRQHLSFRSIVVSTMVLQWEKCGQTQSSGDRARQEDLCQQLGHDFATLWSRQAMRATLMEVGQVVVWQA